MVNERLYRSLRLNLLSISTTILETKKDINDKSKKNKKLYKEREVFLRLQKEQYNSLKPDIYPNFGGFDQQTVNRVRIKIDIIR